MRRTRVPNQGSRPVRHQADLQPSVERNNVGSIINPNGQHLMSQQQAAEMYAVQQFQATYLGLVQVFAADLLRRQNTDDDWRLDEERQKLDTDWICDNARNVAMEAMKRLGINIV